MPFVTGSTARTTVALVGISKVSSAYYFHRLRLLIFQHISDEFMLYGEVQVDESYFGGRSKGQRSLGAEGKVSIFSLLKCGGKSTRALYQILKHLV